MWAAVPVQMWAAAPLQMWAAAPLQMWAAVPVQIGPRASPISARTWRTGTSDGSSKQASLQTRI